MVGLNAISPMPVRKLFMKTKRADWCGAKQVTSPSLQFRSSVPPRVGNTCCACRLKPRPRAKAWLGPSVCLQPFISPPSNPNRRQHMIRQGDVLLVPCDLPDDAQISNGAVKRVVLAEGEATGHAHVIKGSILTATAGGRTL